MLDVEHDNEVNLDFLVSLMKNFNIRKIDEKEKDLILECLDLDKDGKIGLGDIQTLLMNEFTKERRFIVSYILSTLLNNISSKKDGFKLFDDGKLNKAFVILELAFYVYSFCPCFEHSQRMISMLVYFDDELKSDYSCFFWSLSSSF